MAPPQQPQQLCLSLLSFSIMVYCCIIAVSALSLSLSLSLSIMVHCCIIAVTALSLSLSLSLMVYCYVGAIARALSPLLLRCYYYCDSLSYLNHHP